MTNEEAKYPCTNCDMKSACYREGGRCQKVTDWIKMSELNNEKQIPKKPKLLTYKLLLDEGWKYECPTCGCACGENKNHAEITADDLYCTQCGQAIDRSEK